MLDLMEVQEKHQRIQGFFEKTGYEALIIGRQDNFAWYTCGGCNRVIITAENGVGLLVITRDKRYLVAETMDLQRIVDEELHGLDIEPIAVKWFEDGREECAARLVRGLKTLSDVDVKGTDYRPEMFFSLHYPLTGKEIEKLRIIGARTESIIRRVADELKPGMTEREAEAMLLCEYAKENMTVDVLLVGSDERIGRYRHPNPSDRKIGRLVLLHPAVRKWGLHANVTRMVYFGDRLPDDVRIKYEAVNTIQAAAISMCIPGTCFSSILNARKELYKELGFEDEWMYHYPGAVTGYILANPTVCTTPGLQVTVNQAYDWFITITGVKVEELSINTEKGREVLSVTGKWPVRSYTYNGQTFDLPAILLK